MARKRKRREVEKPTESPARYSQWFTEELWLTLDDLATFGKGLQSLELDRVPGITPQKHRLVELACARRVTHFDPRAHLVLAIGYAEQVGEDPTKRHMESFQAIYTQLSHAFNWVADPYSPDDPPESQRTPLERAVAELGYYLRNGFWEVRYIGQDAAEVAVVGGVAPDWHSATQPILAIIRDVYGNPFRKPPKFDKRWRTSTVLDLTRGMWATHDFSAMPILADALQDAGCENADILNHCREPNGVHVRGCFVVDLCLGRE